jgi:Tol biopolymer transport system component
LARKIVSAGFYPRWSPDGSRILFQTSQMRAENEFNVVSLDGKPPRKVSTGFGPLDITMRSAAWHPDGKRISIWVLGPSPVPTFLTVPVSGGKAVESKIDPQVLKQLGEVSASRHDLSADDGQFSWVPSGTAIIFEGTFRGARNLWKMSVDRDTLRANGIERLTTGSGLDTEFALSADGKRIAYTIKSDRVQAWVFPFDGARGRLTGAGRSVTSQSVEAWEPNLSRDGRKLAFSTLRAAKRELWEQSLLDGRERPIAPDDNYGRFNPHWSPDGKRLAYGRASAGSPGGQVFVWSSEGRVEEPLTLLSELGLNLYDWSPDGKQLLVSQEINDHTIQISTLPVTPFPHSEPAFRKVAIKADHYLWEPHFSPDGRWVVFLDQSTQLAHTESIIYVTPATGGPWIRVTDGRFWDDKPQWAADGRTLYFLSRQGGFYDVWGIPFNSAEGKVAGERFRVTNFASSSLMIPNNMGDVALSITRDKLALSMSQVSGSIWVLNDVDQ